MREYPSCSLDSLWYQHSADSNVYSNQSLLIGCSPLLDKSHDDRICKFFIWVTSSIRIDQSFSHCLFQIPVPKSNRSHWQWRLFSIVATQNFVSNPLCWRVFHLVIHKLSRTLFSCYKSLIISIYLLCKNKNPLSSDRSRAFLLIG